MPLYMYAAPIIIVYLELVRIASERYVHIYTVPGMHHMHENIPYMETLILKPS